MSKPGLFSTILSAVYHYYDAKYQARFAPSLIDHVEAARPAYGTPVLRRNIAHAAHLAAVRNPSDTFLKSPELHSYVPR